MKRVQIINTPLIDRKYDQYQGESLSIEIRIWLAQMQSISFSSSSLLNKWSSDRKWEDKIMKLKLQMFNFVLKQNYGWQMVGREQAASLSLLSKPWIWGYLWISSLLNSFTSSSKL